MKNYSANLFEEYKAPAERSRTTPFITIDANARITFSSAATDAFEIKQKKYKSAKLFLSKNEEKVLIAIKLSTEEQEGALNIKFPQQGGSVINAKPFAIKYDLMYGEKLSEKYKKKYMPEKANIEGVGEVFVIQLE